MGGNKAGDVRDSGTAAFKLEEAFHLCPKVPHALGKPGVLWVPVVACGIRAALVECVIDSMVQFRDHLVKLLGSHSGGDINLRISMDVGKETPISPVPWARRGDVLKAERQAKYQCCDPIH